MQIEEGLYLASLTPYEPDFINHGCEPNAGLAGEISIVALRRILPGEEVTIDYAMCDGSPYDQFDVPGGAHCRRRITGDDWRNPVLWERYAGHFSPYIAAPHRRAERRPQAPRLVEAQGRAGACGEPSLESETRQEGSNAADQHDVAQSAIEGLGVFAGEPAAKGKLDLAPPPRVPATQRTWPRSRACLSICRSSSSATPIRISICLAWSCSMPTTANT